MIRGNDLELYDRHAHQWWQPRQRFSRSLHGVNQHRLQQIHAKYGTDLHGLQIADLGCGGGLMSVPLVAAGACVISIDRSAPSLRCAQAHAVPRPCRGDLRRLPLASGWADLVLLADVVEHVRPLLPVLAAAAALLRPGGRCYITTIDRSRLAALLAVRVREGLGLVPAGTHDARLFVRPGELIALGARCGLRLERTQASDIDLLRTATRWQVTLRPGRQIRAAYTCWLVRADADSPLPRPGQSL